MSTAASGAPHARVEAALRVGVPTSPDTDTRRAMATAGGQRPCGHLRSRPGRVALAVTILIAALAPGQVWADSHKHAVTLFWTHNDKALPRATYVTPARRSPAPTAARAKLESRRVRPGSPPAAGRKVDGPIHLRSVDGKVLAAECSAEKLAAYWAHAASEGYSGIAIDEFGATDKNINDKMVRALALTREARPHLFIAVWNAGRLSEKLAQAYARYANLVMLETYFNGDRDLSRRFGRDIPVARRAGILHKTLFALGINDKNPMVGNSYQPWANTPSQLEAQMKWIRSHAPIMPGIAVFAPNASLAIQRTALDLVTKIFGKKATVAEEAPQRTP